MRANQRTIVEFIDNELAKLNMEAIKLNYKKGKLVVVDTANGSYLFTYNKRLELLTKLED